ncbi:hypothetical protein MOK21_11235 [Lysinibacillus sp. BPa_S21]|nr:hypothetical protein [Lysinibacillus sp. BPa_S21]
MITLEVLTRKKRLVKGVGFITYVSKDADGELIHTFAPVINYKTLFMIAICETYWYEHSTKERIGFRWKDKELIIGKVALKFKNT